MSDLAFYLPPEHWGQEVSLCGTESRHLSKVLRLAKGETVVLLDGCGRQGRFCIRSFRDGCVQLERQDEQLFPRPAARAVMALAVGKAVRRGFFLEKAVELGADAIWIWQAQYSQNKLVPSWEKTWKSQMIAGAKQCKNPWLPELRTFPQGIEAALDAASGADHKILLWEMQDGIPMLTAEMTGREGVSVYLIGPEGGFSPMELTATKTAGFAAASLGTRVLRCETAATLCLGLHWWSSHLHGMSVEARNP
jgi:16S rRNA (uracil1498-N3)-methyltransferase